MNRFIICAIVLFSALSAFSDSNAETKRFSTKRNSLKTANISIKSESLQRPLVRKDYMYISGDWSLVATTNITYDSKGQVVEERSNEQGDEIVTTYEYDDYGNRTLILVTVAENGVSENYMKRTYEYDSVVTDYCVSRMGYDWDNNEWVKNYFCETNTITRNASGNISDIVKSLPLNDEMVPAYRMSWSYNADNVADEFIYFVNYQGATDNWEAYDNLSYRDIVWDRTDGQMTDQLDMLTSGKNRFKSYTVYYNDRIDGYAFVDYTSPDSDDYVLKSTYSDPNVVGEVISRETLDRYGSYRMKDAEYFDENGNPTEEPVYTLTENVMIDQYGNIFSDELYETFGTGADELVAGEQIRYTYNKDGQIVETIQLTYDYDSKAYSPEFKTVYSDFNDISGVASIKKDNLSYSVNAGEFTCNAEGMTGISIMDLQGNTLKTTKASKGKATINIDDLPKGIYLAVMTGTGYSVKFMH